MKFQLTYLLLAIGLPLVLAQARTIPLTAEAWADNGLPVRFERHLGARAMHIGDAGPEMRDAAVTLRDFAFRDGTIEFDLALDSSFFSALHFRRADGRNSEHIYLRTFFAGETRVNEALQYAAIVDGVNYWDLSPEYQAAVGIRDTGWNHVKLVARGRQLLVYVNDATRPALYVPRTDTDLLAGELALAGRGYYANLTFDPATPGLSGDEGRFAGGRDGRYLDRWRVSEPVAIPTDRSLTRLEIPRDSSAWRVLGAERFGLLNLSRPFGKTADGTRRLAWLTATIESDDARVATMDLGFSDEVAVYLNGELLYADENRYGTPQMKYPRGRISADNAQVSVPLEEGSNVLHVALANSFFGWGLVARVRETGGLRW